MWNMAVNNISYPIYPFSTRTEKGYITKMKPFFFCSVYVALRSAGGIKQKGLVLLSLMSSVTNVIFKNGGKRPRVPIRKGLV